MKALKKIAQVVAALLYASLFAFVMYLILVLPLAWLLSLNTKIMILAVLLLGGLITGITIAASALIAMPFAWICKDNIVAVIVSLAISVASYIYYLVIVWRDLHGLGGSAIVIAILITVFIVEALSFSVNIILGSYKQ